MKAGSGAPTFFTQVEEEIIANLCTILCREHNPITLPTLNMFMQEHINYRRRRLCQERGHEFNAENEGFTPLSRTWYVRFLKVNNLSLRICEKLTGSYRNASKEDVERWFKMHEEHFRQINVWDTVMKDPKRIFNVNETRLLQHTNPKKVIAPKGEKTIQQSMKGEPKAGTTVTICGNAAGELAPTLFTLPGKNQPRGIQAGQLPESAHIAMSKKGWTTTDTFLQYLDILNSWLQDRNTEKPVVLFADLHSSRLSVSVMQYARDHGIILTGLPPNLTYVMQPLDVSVMRPIKVAYMYLYTSWSKCNQGKLQIDEHIKMAMEAVTVGANADNLQSGFRTCGIHPWNPEKPHINRIPTKSGDQPMLFGAITEGVQMNITNPCPAAMSTVLHRSTQDNKQTPASSKSNIIGEFQLVDLDEPSIERVTRLHVSEPSISCKKFVENSHHQKFLKQQLMKALQGYFEFFQVESFADAISSVITGPVTDYYTEFLANETTHPRHTAINVDAHFMETIQKTCSILETCKETPKKRRSSAHQEIYTQTKSLDLSSEPAINVIKLRKTKKIAVSPPSANSDSAVQKLEKRAITMGKVVKDNEGNGNCFFLAVADQMYGETHVSLRMKAVDEMRRTPNSVRGFYYDHDTMDQYLARMTEDGYWVDHPTINALSRAIKRSIHIVAEDKDFDVLINENFPSTIYVGHIRERHYVALLPADFAMSDTCSVATEMTTASSTSIVVPPIPNPVDWFVVLHEGVPHVAYQLQNRQMAEEICQEVIIFPEECSFGKRTYNRVGEETINVNILKNAQQIVSVSGRGSRKGMFRFDSCKPIDCALLRVQADL
jgi:hypothetical protein